MALQHRLVPRIHRIQELLLEVPDQVLIGLLDLVLDCHHHLEELLVVLAGQPVPISLHLHKLIVDHRDVSVYAATESMCFRLDFLRQIGRYLGQVSHNVLQCLLGHTFEVAKVLHHLLV